jgi:histone-lysine N-methyltransferase SETMAR
MEKIGHRYVMTILSFERPQYNQYQSGARFYSGRVCSFVYNVKYWAAEFKRGRTSCQDEHGSGRPIEVTTPEMEKKMHKMVLDDRRLKVHELADMVGISKSAIHRILTENLDMRKLCARWVPRLLTMEQKQRREDVSVECLAKFHSNKSFCVDS